jgi:hypothetical protein
MRKAITQANIPTEGQLTAACLCAMKFHFLTSNTKTDQI